MRPMVIPSYGPEARPHVVAQKYQPDAHQAAAPHVKQGRFKGECLPRQWTREVAPRSGADFNPPPIGLTVTASPACTVVRHELSPRYRSLRFEMAVGG